MADARAPQASALASALAQISLISPSSAQYASCDSFTTYPSSATSIRRRARENLCFLRLPRASANARLGQDCPARVQASAGGRHR
jgi:hypothetical protein